MASLHYRGGHFAGTNFHWEINGTEGDIVVTAPVGHIQHAPLTLLGARGDAAELAVLPVPESYSQGPVTGPARYRPRTWGCALLPARRIWGCAPLPAIPRRPPRGRQQRSGLLGRRRAAPKYPQCFQHALTDPAVSESLLARLGEGRGQSAHLDADRASVNTLSTLPISRTP